jgi:hypothetical protein
MNAPPDPSEWLPTSKGLRPCIGDVIVILERNRPRPDGAHLKIESNYLATWGVAVLGSEELYPASQPFSSTHSPLPSRAAAQLVDGASVGELECEVGRRYCRKLYSSPIVSVVPNVTAPFRSSIAITAQALPSAPKTAPASPPTQRPRLNSPLGSREVIGFPSA